VQQDYYQKQSNDLEKIPVKTMLFNDGEMYLTLGAPENDGFYAR